MSEENKAKPTITVVIGLEESLRDLLRLHKRYVHAEVDAGACGTRQDFAKLRDAEEKFLDAREAMNKRLNLLDQVGAEFDAAETARKARGC